MQLLLLLGVSLRQLLGLLLMPLFDLLSCWLRRPLLLKALMLLFLFLLQLLPFLLLAVAKLNLLEASLVAIAAGLAQCLGGNSRPEPVKVLFSVSNLVPA